MNKNFKNCIMLCILVSLFLMIAGCSSASPVQSDFEHIDPGYTNSYYFDVFTPASKDSPRTGIIELQSYDDDIYFQIENAGQERELAIQIFIGCRLTPIIIDNVEYETFLIDSKEILSETYSFKLAKPLDTSKNHSMLAILIAGSDIYTNQVEFEMTNQYSIALDHVLMFGEDLPMAQSDYGYEEVGLVTEYQSAGLLLNTDIENNSRAIPEREIIVHPEEEFSLQYQVGGYQDCDEVAVIITVGLEQAKINNQDYILCKVREGELIHGTAGLKAPAEAGEYEIMGWVIKNPFDTDKTEYFPLDAAYRFTLTVK